MLSQKLDEILCELIKIPSQTNYEDMILDFIRKNTDKKEFIKDYDDGKNILLSLAKNKSTKHTILIAGHVDTVPAVNEAQFIPKIEKKDGKTRVYGRGSVDMKAGIAVMLKLMHELVDKETRHNIKFLFYSGEEGPLPNGLSKVIESGVLKDISTCIIPEPSSSKLACSCMGAITAEVIIQGKAAHSAWPDEGLNAIYEANELINKVKNYGSRKLIFNGLECYETMNVTKIKTNNAHNVIPASCSLTINYRFPPNKSLKDAEKELLKIVSDHKMLIMDKSPSSSANLKEGILNTESFERIVFQAWSDIAQLNHIGIAAINFGPGDIVMAHKEDEYIHLEDIDTYYKKLCNLIGV